MRSNAIINGASEMAGNDSRIMNDVVRVVQATSGRRLDRGSSPVMPTPCWRQAMTWRTMASSPSSKRR